jgi:mono/diheme cytochrome c family protein
MNNLVPDRRTAKPPFVGSNPTRASKFFKHSTSCLASNSGENTPTTNAQTKVTKAHEAILIAIKMMIVCVALAVPQGFASPRSTSQQKEPVRRADITSGKKIFVNYCASCHGVDGKGDGPAAAALKPAPTDLTILAKANEGKYPAGFVSAMLKFGRNPAAHGSSEMPVWGSRFKMIDPSQDPTGQQHVDDVVAYIGSLQGK